MDLQKALEEAVQTGSVEKVEATKKSEIIDILVSIHLTESQRKKIAWDCGQDNLPDEVACKDWVEDLLQGAFDDLPSPPKNT